MSRCAGSRSQTRRNEARCCGVKRTSRAGEGDAVAVTAARVEVVTAEIGVTPRWARGRVEGSDDVLQGVQRKAHERGVGDSEDVRRLEV